jgi:hypothetical protein
LISFKCRTEGALCAPSGGPRAVERGVLRTPEYQVRRLEPHITLPHDSCVPRPVLIVLLVTVLAACHPQPPSRTPPDVSREEYCWWAVHRSPLPVDSVAWRFGRAFEAVGLQATSQALGDTIWVYGNPTGGARSARFRSRAVAYQHGDSTRYRYYVELAAPLDTARAQTDRPNLIGVCGQIAKVAAIPGSTPREPTGEESLAVWTRRP